MLNLRKKIGLLPVAVLLGFFISNALIGASGHAQGPYKGEWVLPKHYPNGFDGWGRIDRLADHEVVIDDTLHGLSSTVTYNIFTNTNIPSSWFHVGDIVGYLKNARGEIISLWRIP